MSDTPMPWDIPGAPHPRDFGRTGWDTPVKKNYPIATICGTMKLAENMASMADELTRRGYIVLMPNSLKGGGWLANPTPITDSELDQMHRAKIDMADLVVFVTQEKRYVWGDRTNSSDLYFGESTTAELKYARSLGKRIKVVRMQRRNYKDTIIWIDPANLELG